MAALLLSTAQLKRESGSVAFVNIILMQAMKPNQAIPQTRKTLPSHTQTLTKLWTTLKSQKLFQSLKQVLKDNCETFQCRTRIKINNSNTGPQRCSSLVKKIGSKSKGQALVALIVEPALSECTRGIAVREKLFPSSQKLKVLRQKVKMELNQKQQTGPALIKIVQTHNKSLPNLQAGVSLKHWDCLFKYGRHLQQSAGTVSERRLQYEGKISAEAYFAISLLDLQVMYCKNEMKRLEMASLTKVHTCLTVLYASSKFAIPLDSQVKVTQSAAKTEGTEARLNSWDRLSLNDLLYGLMLPSGNDAATALAQFIGRAVQKRRKSMTSAEVKTKTKNNSSVVEFLKEMNSVAKQLGMLHSNFASPHGLNNQKNYSCARDIALLCGAALTNAQFRKIVACKQYSATIYNERTGLQRQELWTNSNRLLGEPGYFGVKTGKTSAAGPCFAGFCKILQQELVTVVLNSKGPVSRFEDAHKLVGGALAKKGLKYPKDIRLGRLAKLSQIN